MNFELPLSIDRYYLTAVLRAVVHSVFFHRSFMLTRPVEVSLDSLDITYIRVDDSEMERTIDDRIAQFVKSLDNASLPVASAATPTTPSLAHAHSHAQPIPFKSSPARHGGSSTASSAASSLKSTSSASNLAAIAAAGFSKVAVVAAGSLGADVTAGEYAFIVSFSERKQKKSGTSWFTNDAPVVPWEQWTIRLHITQSRTEREQIQAKKSVETQLLSALIKITQYANENKDHVPPITTQDGYPFPVQMSFTNSDQSWRGLVKNLIG
ncbi:autophagy-related protein [Chytriomyces sp. MP71]|nr:autophagy-related protein [Chytriomyces sp. MP71]